MPTQLDKIKIRIKILIVHELKTKMYSLKTLSGWQKIYVSNSQKRAYVKMWYKPQKNCINRIGIKYE